MYPFPFVSLGTYYRVHAETAGVASEEHVDVAADNLCPHADALGILAESLESVLRCVLFTLRRRIRIRILEAPPNRASDGQCRIDPARMRLITVAISVAPEDDKLSNLQDCEVSRREAS